MVQHTQWPFLNLSFSNHFPKTVSPFLNDLNINLQSKYNTTVHHHHDELITSNTAVTCASLTLNCISFKAYTPDPVPLWAVSLLICCLPMSPRRFKKLKNSPVFSVLIHVLLGGTLSLFLCTWFPVGSSDLPTSF